MNFDEIRPYGMPLNRDGWQVITESRGVKEIKVQTEMEFDMYRDSSLDWHKYTMHNITHNLAKAIISEKLFSYKRFSDDLNRKDIIQATIHVAEPGIKYINKQNGKFIVNGEEFSNDDLVKAVKYTFPERLI